MVSTDSIENDKNDVGTLDSLLASTAGEPDQVVWAHASANVRETLTELLTEPGRAPPHLQTPIQQGDVRFRTAQTPSLDSLGALVNRLIRETRPGPLDV